jgi:cytochrome c biogenesis protein CcmG, thiol:disulfide interchange protein DsbE
MGPATVFIILLAVASAQRGGPPAVGHKIPPFSGPLLGGNGTLSSSDLAGRPVLLNFWASWCVPCKKEAPLLERAYRRFGDRVRSLGIDVHDGRSDALAFQKKYGTPYPSIVDVGSQIYERYGLTGQPESFFVGADQVLVLHVPGELPSSSYLSKELRRLLQKRA